MLDDEIAGFSYITIQFTLILKSSFYIQLHFPFVFIDEMKMGLRQHKTEKKKIAFTVHFRLNKSFMLEKDSRKHVTFCITDDGVIVFP